MHHALWNITTCIWLLLRFLKALRCSSEDMSCRLDFAVKSTAALQYCPALAGGYHWHLSLPVQCATPPSFPLLHLEHGLTCTRSHLVPCMPWWAIFSQIIHCLTDESGILTILPFIGQNDIMFVFIINTEVGYSLRISELSSLQGKYSIILDLYNFSASFSRLNLWKQIMAI